MRVKIKQLYEAISSFRSEVALWDRPDLEVDISFIEADMKENLVDVLHISAEFVEIRPQSNDVKHSVTLECFDISDNQKPVVTHQTKKQLT